MVAAKRTPFGRLGGSLRDLKPAELLTLTTVDTLKAAGAAPGIVGSVNVGMVNTVRIHLL